MYLRPTITGIMYADNRHAHFHSSRSAVVVESTQTTENIIGYIILAIAVALVLVGAVSVVLVRRCCACFKELRVRWRRRKTRRRIHSWLSSTAPNEKGQISTTTVLRSDPTEKTIMTPTTDILSSPLDKVFSDPPPYGCCSHEASHYEPNNNNYNNNNQNNSTIYSLRSPSPVHVNVFNDPRRNPPFEIHEDGMVVVESIGAASDSSTTNNTPGGTGLFLSPSATTPIRPHGIPLTPLPEDASAVFPMPYFESDEQTLYGTVDSESDHDHPHLVHQC